LPQGEFAYSEREKLQRSLKEAAGELQARLAANTERRFPVMGLRGAAGALMLREMRLRLARPIVAITSTAPEAEALAGEAALFLDEAADADAGRAGQRDAFRLRHQRPVRPAQSRCALPVIARPHLCPASSSEEPNDRSRRIDLTVPRPHNLGVAGTNSAQHRSGRLQFFRCRVPLYRQNHASRPYQAHG